MQSRLSPSPWPDSHAPFMHLSFTPFYSCSSFCLNYLLGFLLSSLTEWAAMNCTCVSTGSITTISEAEFLLKQGKHTNNMSICPSPQLSPNVNDLQSFLDFLRQTVPFFSVPDALSALLYNVYHGALLICTSPLLQQNIQLLISIYHTSTSAYFYHNVWQMYTELINADIRAIRIIGHARDVITGPSTSKSFVIQLYKYGFCQMDCYYLVQTQKASAVLCT